MIEVNTLNAITVSKKAGVINDRTYIKDAKSFLTVFLLSLLLIGGAIWTFFEAIGTTTPVESEYFIALTFEGFYFAAAILVRHFRRPVYMFEPYVIITVVYILVYHVAAVFQLSAGETVRYGVDSTKYALIGCTFVVLGHIAFTVAYGLESNSCSNKRLKAFYKDVANEHTIVRTAYIIYKFMESRTEDAEDSRNVMVKILVPGSDETRNRVILATNNQTQVKKTSLRATDQIHIQIELYMKRNGLYYERRKNYYKNQGRKREEIVTLSFLAQCMMSILLGRPDQAKARPSTLLSDEVQYKKIFGQDGNLEAYYRAASLGKQVCLKFPQIKRDLEGSQISDIRFYVIMGVASMLSNKDSLTFGDIENLDLDKLSDEIIQTVADMVMDVYLALGGTSKAAKSYAMASKVKEKISLLLP